MAYERVKPTNNWASSVSLCQDNFMAYKILSFIFYPLGKGAVKVAIMSQSTVYFKEALKTETNLEN